LQKQEGGFESTKLRYASMSISNAKTCGDYTEQEFQTGIMFCADNSAATRNFFKENLFNFLIDYQLIVFYFDS
jgi:hypothetical protein